MFFLLIGAVTSASNKPSFKSLVARSSAAKAALPASSVARPNSTFNSSSQQLMMLMRFLLTSLIELIMFKLIP